MKRRAKSHQLLVWHQKYAKKDWRDTQAKFCNMDRKRKSPHTDSRRLRDIFRPRITTHYAITTDMTLSLIHGLEWTGKGYKSLITGREI